MICSRSTSNIRGFFPGLVRFWVGLVSGVPWVNWAKNAQDKSRLISIVSLVPSSTNKPVFTELYLWFCQKCSWKFCNGFHYIDTTRTQFFGNSPLHFGTNLDWQLPDVHVSSIIILALLTGHISLIMLHIPYVCIRHPGILHIEDKSKSFLSHQSNRICPQCMTVNIAEFRDNVAVVPPGRAPPHSH